MQREPGPTASLPPDDDEDALAAMLLAVEDGDVDLAPSDGPRLLSLLAHPAKRLRRRAAGAVAASVSRGTLAAGDCEVLLASADEATCWGSAFALAKAGVRSPAVLAAALAALGSDDGDVRWAAASIVIAEARGDDSLRAGLRRLAREGTPPMRKMSVLCLADSGRAESGILVAALRDAEASVRLAALTAIARSGDAEASTLSAVRDVAAGDGEARIRRAAAAVVERLEAIDRTTRRTP